MIENNWQEETAKICEALNSLTISSSANEPIDVDGAFLEWKKVTEQVRIEDKTVYLIGNGASASMASHFAADLSKNAHVRTQVFSDLSQITAIANDIDYSQIFALPLNNFAKSGDMLICISSSGASKNIVEAVKVAKEKGVTVITLTSFKDDNPLSKAGDLNFYVSADTYGLAETAHAAVLHYWMDSMLYKSEVNIDGQ